MSTAGFTTCCAVSVERVRRERVHTGIRSRTRPELRGKRERRSPLAATLSVRNAGSRFGGCSEKVVGSGPLAFTWSSETTPIGRSRQTRRGKLVRPICRSATASGTTSFLGLHTIATAVDALTPPITPTSSGIDADSPTDSPDPPLFYSPDRPPLTENSRPYFSRKSKLGCLRHTHPSTDSFYRSPPHTHPPTYPPTHTPPILPPHTDYTDYPTLRFLRLRAPSTTRLFPTRSQPHTSASVDHLTTALRFLRLRAKRRRPDHCLAFHLATSASVDCPSLPPAVSSRVTLDARDKRGAKSACDESARIPAEPRTHA